MSRASEANPDGTKPEPETPKLCPILGKPCIEAECAWWLVFSDKGACAVVEAGASTNALVPKKDDK